MHTYNLQKTLSCLVLLLLLIGTGGYVSIEGWPILDSIYMTLITISTVGFGEIQELTMAGRVFTSVLIMFSLMLMACWTSGITSILVSGELSGRFQKQRDRKMIDKMQEHVIVCGGGVIASTVIRELSVQGKPVVAITNDASEIELLKRTNPEIPILQDDPKSELALADAAVFRASYIVAASESDFDNLLITITGKGLGTNIRVLSCAQSTELASRMLKVGADEVICPFIICGEHVAELITGSNTADCAVPVLS